MYGVCVNFLFCELIIHSSFGTEVTVDFSLFGVEYVLNTEYRDPKPTTFVEQGPVVFFIELFGGML